MAEQNNTNHDHPNLYRPASEPATLLFLALPYLVPSVRPLAELCFHLLELHHLLKRKETADFSSLFSGSWIADKDGLLSSLKNGCDEKYRPMFEMLANLSQIMQFYQMYQEMMPLLQGLGMGTGMGETTNPAGLFEANNPLTSMLFSNLSNIMNTGSVSDSSNETFDTSSSPAPSNDNNHAENATHATSYDDLLALLSPEQKELFEQLQGMF